jgi:hypothetical protein
VPAPGKHMCGVAVYPGLRFHGHGLWRGRRPHARYPRCAGGRSEAAGGARRRNRSRAAFRRGWGSWRPANGRQALLRFSGVLAVIRGATPSSVDRVNLPEAPVFGTLCALWWLVVRTDPEVICRGGPKCLVWCGIIF